MLWWPALTRLGTALVMGVFLTVLGLDSRAQGRSGFQVHAVNADSLYPSPASYGWSTSLAPGVKGVSLVALGVYDPGGDGLLHPHEVGIWTYDNVSGVTSLVRDVTIPAGGSAALVDGYRYVAIQPLSLRPNESLGLVAFYPQVDADSLTTPESITIASEFVAPRNSSRWAPGATLTIPTQPICPGVEGEPCLNFYPVNFRFEVVPEPGPLWLLGIGGWGIGLWWRRGFREERLDRR